MFEYSQEIIGKNLSAAMKRTDAELTRRENEVLSLLAKGMNREEIAAKLFISPETVKMHLKNLYKKLKAKNKVDALIKMKML